MTTPKTKGWVVVADRGKRMYLGETGTWHKELEKARRHESERLARLAAKASAIATGVETWEMAKARQK